jgi:uncharacterized protein (TIGR03435 family)
MRGLYGGCAALLAGAVWCQSTGSDTNRPVFDIADVHSAPRADWVKKPANNMQGGFLNSGRYELRRATMLELIRTAYDIEADKIYGGPNWLDYDKFEVIAKAPEGTKPGTLRLMLQSLLANRFKLVAKMDTRPMPAYVLSMGKDKPKLKPSEGEGVGRCQGARGAEPRTTRLECRGVTMETLAAEIRQVAGRALTGNTGGSLPVVDSTGLEGTWDFDLTYGALVTNMNTGVTTQEGGGIVEAVNKQLGLTLELSKAPQPVLVVESVNEQPSPNPPGIAAALPPPPAPQFEVASIRPCDRNAPVVRTPETGSRVTRACVYPTTLIQQIFNVNPTSPQLTGLPKGLADSTDSAFTVIAEAPEGTIPDGITAAQRNSIINSMMLGLLVDRFKLAYHYEDKPVDAYTLVAVKPKLTRANPENRTGCTRQVALGALPELVCTNITMAQFAEQIQSYEPGIFFPVADGTGLEGAWDFKLTYNPEQYLGAQLQQVFANARARAGVDAPAPSTEASAPTGSTSFFDAVEKQLGLKLEMHKRPAPVLVIDHLEQKPTDN